VKERVKSGFIMAPILVIVFLGGYALVAGVFALTILALREYRGAFGEGKPSWRVLLASAIVLYGGFLIPALRESILAPWMFVSVVLCFLSMFAVEKTSLAQGLATFTGVFYVIFLAFHIVLVDAFYPVPKQPLEIGGGIPLSGIHSYVWIVVLSAFGTDIFAYFTGVLIGKRKLCEKISPKKTVEGSIGGALGSVLLCGLFGHFFLPAGLADCIAIGLLGGVLSQVGDLSASVLKRKLGVKDWGALIPGHGGVLDRIDSILFTAPLTFYYLFIKTALGA
jgi:phosphatidate cytidylyltransferase